MTPTYAHEVQDADVTFRWTVEGDEVRAEMSAPTRGWVCAGISGVPGLDRSLLVMGAVIDGTARAEEHVAMPPRHPRRADLGGRIGLLAFDGEEDDGRTTIRFTLRLVDDGLVVLPGQTAYLTLAWSHEDDFQHHSARRTEVAVPWR